MAAAWVATSTTDPYQDHRRIPILQIPVKAPPWGRFFLALPGALLGGVHLNSSMALIPRWRYMTDEAKALSRRTAFSALVFLSVLLVVRSLMPWLLVGLIA